MKHQGSTPGSIGDVERRRLQRYAELLLERAAPAGMIARADAAVIKERHLDDALRGRSFVGDGMDVVDLGSGAGLPGVPLAIACPQARFLLVEARRSRASFLEYVVDDLSLGNVHVHAGRLEDVEGVFDLATARAFASPAGTWAVAARLIPDGSLLYWAGATFALDQAPVGVRVDVFRDASLANAGPLVIMARQ